MFKIGTSGRERKGVNFDQQTIDSVVRGEPTFRSRIADSIKYIVAGVTPSTWMSPQQPLSPMADKEEQGTIGRQMDFRVGHNLTTQPRADESVSFQQLRALADGYDLMRIIIETRKDQVEKYRWEFVPKKKGEEQDAGVLRATEFFEKPSTEHDWSGWLRIILEDLLVLDAVTLYPQKSFGGKIIAFEPVDAATIKRVIDQSGRTPQPPSPAYQQVLKGIPAVDYTTEEMLYRMRNPRSNRIYGYCYDDITEILTRTRGWVLFDELCDGDEVATRSCDGEFQWQKPSRVVREEWDGDMHHFSSRSMDLMVTPEHRMLVDTLPRSLGGNKTRKGDAIITAEQLVKHGNSMVKIPVTSRWLGEEVEEISFNGVGQKTLNLSGDDFCALMGAYLAEGNLRSAGGIEIAQLEKSKGFTLYKDLFDRIGGSYNGRSFILSLRAITEYFRTFGHAHEKFIPQLILNATPRQLEIFWDFYIAGDGCHESRPNETGRGSQPDSAESATTVSKRLADGLVEIAQKLGFSASVSIKAASQQEFNIKGKRYISNCRESYKIRCRYSKAMSVTSEVVHYAGGIYCVTVPNGIVYVRRNGKPAWSGNSPVEQIVMTVNIALRRQLHQLAYYTDGNVPEALAAVDPSWTADQIREFQSYFDDMLSGNLNARRKLTFIPGDAANLKFTREPTLKDQMDDWLARITCYAFSVPSTPFISQVNRATAETADESAKEEGLMPILLWIKRLVDGMLPLIGVTGVEFKWKMDEGLSPEVKASMDREDIKIGAKTIDDMRQSRGEMPLENGLGSKPLVYIAGGVMLLEDALKAKEKEEQAAKEQKESDATKATATTTAAASQAKAESDSKKAEGKKAEGKQDAVSQVVEVAKAAI